MNFRGVDIVYDDSVGPRLAHSLEQINSGQENISPFKTYRVRRPETFLDFLMCIQKPLETLQDLLKKNGTYNTDAMLWNIHYIIHKVGWGNPGINKDRAGGEIYSMKLMS